MQLVFFLAIICIQNCIFCMCIIFYTTLQLVFIAFWIVIGGNVISPVNTPFYLKLQHYSFAAVAWSHLSARNNGSEQVQKATFKTVLQVLTLLKTFWNTHTHTWMKRSLFFMQITCQQQKHADFFSCMLPVTLYCPRSFRYRAPQRFFFVFIFH